MKIKLISLSCILLIFICIMIVIFIINKDQIFTTGKVPDTLTHKDECPIKVEEKIVRGNSLSGLIEAGEEVTILSGYYNCNEIKRDDIIIYDFPANKNPIIKIVKAIPGDKFYLQKANNGWNILINEEILTNSQKQPYLLNEGGYRMLFLYEKSYNRTIPGNAYLILGNSVSGSLDSSQFGLIGKPDILGKVTD